MVSTFAKTMRATLHTKVAQLVQWNPRPAGSNAILAAPEQGAVSSSVFCPAAVLEPAMPCSDLSTPRELRTSIGSPRPKAGTVSLQKQVIFNESMSRCHRHTCSDVCIDCFGITSRARALADNRSIDQPIGCSRLLYSR